MSKEKIEEKELTDKQESQEKDQTTGQNTDGQDKEEQTGSGRRASSPKSLVWKMSLQKKRMTTSD